jgi:hypothetical protein
MGAENVPTPLSRVRTADQSACTESLHQLGYHRRHLPPFKLTFRCKNIFFGFETRLVGIDVSETTLFYYQERLNGEGKVVRIVVLFLQPFRQY